MLSRYFLQKAFPWKEAGKRGKGGGVMRKLQELTTKLKVKRHALLSRGYLSSKPLLEERILCETERGPSSPWGDRQVSEVVKVFFKHTKDTISVHFLSWALFPAFISTNEDVGDELVWPFGRCQLSLVALSALSERTARLPAATLGDNPCPQERGCRQVALSFFCTVFDELQLILQLFPREEPLFLAA